MGEFDRIVREAVALHEAGQYQQALQLYDDAVSRWPSLALLWNNRGTTLLEQARYAEAAESYRRALQLAPELHDARVALASCLQSLGYLNEAQAACDIVLQAVPDHAEAHWNQALLLLLQGNYAMGWQEYEWRWKKRRFTSPQRQFIQPQWQGEPLTGKTILIHAEQGFGDTLQFCRYLPFLAASASQVVFECHPQLTALMETLSPGITVVAMGQPLPPFDCHLPLMSLPRLFGTTLETIPAAVPYLQPPPVRLPFWRSVVPERNGNVRVGLCWARKRFPDPDRCCPAALLDGLSICAGVEYYSLQLDTFGLGRPSLPLVDLTSQLLDFADTAALASQLDLIISVDTAVAHLAGALGLPCWLLLSTDVDWRWLLRREDSPWYPTLRLFRQQQPGNWAEVLERVALALQDR
jgi:hypothetical protein